MAEMKHVWVVLFVVVIMQMNAAMTALMQARQQQLACAVAVLAVRNAQMQLIRYRFAANREWYSRPRSSSWFDNYVMTVGGCIVLHSSTSNKICDLCGLMKV